MQLRDITIAAVALFPILFLVLICQSSVGVADPNLNSRVCEKEGRVLTERELIDRYLFKDNANILVLGEKKREAALWGAGALYPECCYIEGTPESWVEQDSSNKNSSGMPPHYTMYFYYPSHNNGHSKYMEKIIFLDACGIELYTAGLRAESYSYDNFISEDVYEANIEKIRHYWGRISDQYSKEIKEYVVGGERYYIPKVYTNFSYTSVGAQSALIQAWYPGSTPVLDDPKDLRKEGRWFWNVRILFSYPPKPNPVGVMNSRISLNKADKEIGREYGLVHYSQFDENRGFNDDIYIEDSKSGAFIACGKKKTPLDNIQLCEHHFSKGNVSFEITYNKRLLSDWSLIKENVLAMHHSFKSSHEAELYLRKFLPLGEVGHE